MSEIDIEKKESGGIPWWLWLLGALVLAAIIWYAIAAMSAKTGTPLATNGNTAMVADNSAVDNGVAENTMSNNTVSDNAMATDTNAMAPAMDANSAMDSNATATSDANSAMSNGMSNGTMDQSMSNSAANTSTVPAASAEAITNILSVVDAKDPAALYGKNVKLLGAPVQAAGTKVFWIGPSFQQKMLVVTDASTKMNGINTGVAQRDRVNIEGKLQQITDFKDAKTKYDLDDSAVTFLTNKKMLLMATSVSRDKN